LDEARAAILADLPEGAAETLIVGVEELDVVEGVGNTQTLRPTGVSPTKRTLRINGTDFYD